MRRGLYRAATNWGTSVGVNFGILVQEGLSRRMSCWGFEDGLSQLVDVALGGASASWNKWRKVVR